MKKRLAVLLTAVFVVLVCSASFVNAESNMQTVQAYKGVKIIYNGNQLSDSNQPYIINNITYIPLRMLMNNFGKNVTWDSVNYQVLITDDAASETSLTDKDAQIATLENTITTLNAKISSLESELNGSSDADLSDAQEALNDYFEDAGYDYFDDSGIDTSISLNGDEDDLVYTVDLDFDDADDYDNLTEVSRSELKSFMSSVSSKLTSEIDGTDFEDADITGKLVDNDNSNYYVKYDGSSYIYSWDDDDDISLSDIKGDLNDYFEDAGDDFLVDDGIETTVTLTGDEDDLAYTVKLDFDDANYYGNLKDCSQSRLKSLLIALRSQIYSEINGTDYEDADITGTLIDNDHSSYYVTYDGNSYTFSWNE